MNRRRTTTTRVNQVVRSTSTMAQNGFEALSEEVNKAAEKHPDDIDKQIEIALACPCVGTCMGLGQEVSITHPRERTVWCILVQRI